MTSPQVPGNLQDLNVFEMHTKSLEYSDREVHRIMKEDRSLPEIDANEIVMKSARKKYKALVKKGGIESPEFLFYHGLWYTTNKRLEYLKHMKSLREKTKLEKAEKSKKKAGTRKSKS